MQGKEDLTLINKYRVAIMGFAALWIFLFHEWSYVTAAYPKIYAIEHFVKRIGFCGVDFFLFLSGIGLVYSIGKHSVLTFYKRRLVRVFIPLFVIGFAMMVAKGWGIELFLKNVLGYNFYASSMYSFLWFGTAILTLYLVFPLYYFLFKKTKRKYLFTAVALLIWLILSLLFEGTKRGDLYGFTNRIPVFVIGILAGWVVQEGKFVFTGFKWFCCLITLILGLFLAYKTNYEGMYLLVSESNCCIPNLLIAISGSCLLAKCFSVLEKYGKLPGKIVMKFFGLFGTISLEFYCVQEWVGSEVRYRLAGTYNNILINIVDFICVVVAAIVLYGVCQIIRYILGKIEKKLSC